MLSENLRSMRNKNKLGIRELERISGVANSTIINIENGKYKNPTIETVLKLAKALNITIDELISAERNGVPGGYHLAMQKSINEYFEKLNRLEFELHSIFLTKIECEELYWAKRNFILGNIEKVIYKIFINGSEEDKRKVIKKMCEFYFIFNMNLYKNYMERYTEIFEEFNHNRFLLYPFDRKEFTHKNKKIITEYYLLGEKVYTDKNKFLYGTLYFSSSLISDDMFGGYHGDLIIGKQLEYMKIR
ncbi:MAG: helix-turn-helix transcriptional regulator [Clostridium sp.]|uniref:helix-turn-helix domain-containing protein n=1 Tax=Clostridium sp. TaxID=1506 RepID=UPI002902E1C7|nr:helix-turn-helix transcriptional regulator [Clostridium sp.]MDU2674226.1 helix-turn-helix transcriptional regulator [Clostridium sp.]MDU2680321.1 helix-turn-helix transcriptional regulator [Clostridium sp.]